MVQQTDVSWQVLQEDDDWNGDSPDQFWPRPSVGTPRSRATRARGWRWITLLMAALLLAGQLWWMIVQPGAATGSVGGNRTSDTGRVAAVRYRESDYFVLAYRPVDEAVVGHGLRLLDQRYGQEARALGLVISPDAPKRLLWALDVDEVAGAVQSPPAPGAHLITAPLTEADAFVCAVLEEISGEIIVEAIPSVEETGSWQIAPAFVQGLWMWVDVRNCSLTHTRNQRESAHYFGAERRLPRLQELVPALYNYPYRSASSGQTERDARVFASLIEYATQKYGAGRLPLLLSELQQPVTWERLIPAVFDVSAAEFEAGWWVWLEEEYGM